ncbi:GNAT family N-acetyltransferase [Hamadaea tsunoensis]|uniref:GNAT family N-acetyltransferase n=1 Tax=Hamadaea tsunoensis TaxID=53368 RepID=UPI0004046669|nr:GNAT family N-acetyltransferase [Hamadaea tsunoensis]
MPMSTPAPVEFVGREPFLAASAALADAYQDAFSGPPWDESDDQVLSFLSGLPEWTARDGFTAAWSAGPAGISGFAFRVRTPEPVPAGDFYAVLRERFGDPVGTLGGRIEVVELAVRPSAQGRGLGRELLRAIVGSEPAWLVTRLAAESTLAFYHRVGWREYAISDGLAILANA